MSSNRPSKRRKLATAPKNDHLLYTNAPTKPRKNKRRTEEQEEDYEKIPRKIQENGGDKLLVKENKRWVEAEKDDSDEVDSFLEGSEDSQSGPEDHEDAEAETQRLPHKQEVLQAQEELARLASLINEDPEEHAGALKALAQVAQSPNLVVKQLTIATQCTVYKDIIPGYRIRPISEDASKEKVSKDVKRLRMFEQSLVAGYQTYIRELAKLTKLRPTSGNDTSGLASTALACASTLLLAVPHFNFRPEITQIVVGALGRNPNGKDYKKAIETIEKLFDEDDDGRPSLDAVGLITKMMRARDYQVHESLLNTFLQLRLLKEFSQRASNNRVDKDDPDLPKQVKKLKEKREYRSKRQRKHLREQKALEKEMQAADAVVSHEERDKLQAEMLKLVFATYFRILKAQTEHLMGAVLEGLAKYAHLINQDFFADILEALKELMSKAAEVDEDEEDEEKESTDDETIRDSTRESLLCIITAFALLQGQDGKAAVSNLHLDLSFFITHLYRSLIPTVLDADVEFSSKSLHLPDPTGANADDDARPPINVNVKTKTVLLIRCLSSVLLPKTALRAIPPLRLAAFTKQLMTSSLQLPEKSCQAMLGLLAQTTKIHGKTVAVLWHTEERRGDGVFDALRGDVEGSNPFASTVWEGELLRLHFSPKVKEALKIVEGNIRAVS